MSDALQEQLALVRRNHILDAAAKVFAHKGFHPTTIKEVAKEAGVADGTIYNYFESKTHLLFAILERMRRASLQDMPDAQTTMTDFYTFLKTYLAQPLLAFKPDNADLFRVVISEIVVNEALRTQYEQEVLAPTIALAEPAFQFWVEAGAMKPVNIPLTLRVISGVLMGMMLQHVISDKVTQEHWETLPVFLSELLFNALSNPPKT